MNLTDVSSKIDLSSPKSKLVQIESLVLVTFLLFFFLLPTRFLRRRYDSLVLRAFSVAASTSALLLIPFIFGMMLNLDFKHELIPVWATFLVLVYATIPDVVDLHRAITMGTSFVKFCLYAIYVFLLFSRVHNSPISLPVRSLLIFIIIRIFEKGASPVMVSSVTNQVGPQCKLRSISKSLFDDLDRPNPNNNNTREAYDNDPILDCKYGVHLLSTTFKSAPPMAAKLFFPQNSQITIGQIWSCQDGSLLSSTTDRGQICELKRTCFSFSLFWMLLHKFAGVPSYESSKHEEAWRLVRDGLLTLANPLKLIEEELSILGDFFYGRYFYVFYFFTFLRHFLFQCLYLYFITSLVVIIFKRYHPADQTIRIQFHGIDVDVLITIIVIILLILIELGQVISLCSSSWAKVNLISIYIRREAWKKKTMSDMIINVLARILCPVWSQRFKPWQRKLGQYSLLESCTFVHSWCWIYLDLFMIYFGIGVKRTAARKESKAKIISPEIEKIVIQSLQDHGRHLTNGIGSLKASNLPEETETKLKLLYWCPPEEVDIDIPNVLLWHIATSICEINPQLPSSVRKSSDFHVAITLSNYCAYLVAFAPDLLPGHPATTHYTCSSAIADAKAHLKGVESSKKYDKLMGIANEEVEAGPRNMDNFLRQGAILGKVLDTEIEDPKRWKVLADFWGEMILYLAPSDNNEWAHAKRLEDGGEFITHLWALLFHAGIVDRNSLNRRNTNATAETSPP